MRADDSWRSALIPGKRMRAEVEERVEAVPVVALGVLDPGAVVVPVARVVVEVEAAVALPTTRHRSLRHH
jgi:hypothetical protein